MKTLVLAERAFRGKRYCQSVEMQQKAERCFGRRTLYCNLGPGTSGHPGQIRRNMTKNTKSGIWKSCL